jgi:hypothetical protein
MEGSADWRGEEADGPTVFAHACKMGLEGIVSKKELSQRSLELGREA